MADIVQQPVIFTNYVFAPLRDRMRVWLTLLVFIGDTSLHPQNRSGKRPSASGAALVDEPSPARSSSGFFKKFLYMFPFMIDVRECRNNILILN
jgi:hypothetical protein